MDAKLNREHFSLSGHCGQLIELRHREKFHGLAVIRKW
jgi:hypothetical protein